VLGKNHVGISFCKIKKPFQNIKGKKRATNIITISLHNEKLFIKILIKSKKKMIYKKSNWNFSKVKNQNEETKLELNTKLNWHFWKKNINNVVYY
jgi:hypothetical protein